MPDHIGQNQHSSDDARLREANEQLALEALRAHEKADASEQRWHDQRTLNDILLKKQRLLRLLASELTLTEQRERKRLATDLHDYLAQ
jgi:signal transduction histidine kinase